MYIFTIAKLETIYRRVEYDNRMALLLLLRYHLSDKFEVRSGLIA